MEPASDNAFDRTLHASTANGEKLLKELGLAGLPSRERVHREIEEKLLLPQERLPDHWLPTYQMYAICVFYQSF
jgi:antiviral helicase SKI2